jgi:hypothetical protein
MNSVLQAIRTTVFHVRSKDGTQLDSNFNTHFSVNLLNPVICNEGEEIHISVSSAEIPYSFYNISSDLENNTLKIDDNGTTYTITISNGSYDIDDLVDAFNNTTDFANRFTMSFDEITLQITFTSLANNLSILWTQSNINKELGFKTNRADDTGISTNDTITSTGVVNLATVHSIMLKSNIATSNVLSTRQGSSSTLQKISIDQNSDGIIYLNAQDFRQITISQSPQIDEIEFRLSDQNDRTIQLNDVNYEFTLLFQIFPQYQRLERQSTRRRGGEDPRVINVPQPIQRIPQQPQFLERIEEDAEEPEDTINETSHKTKRLVLDQLLDTLAKSN